jgi:hypothetical protein
MIVLYVFGIPIAAFIVLRNNRNELHDIETRRKYSFLYAVRSEILDHDVSMILSIDFVLQARFNLTINA